MTALFDLDPAGVAIPLGTWPTADEALGIQAPGRAEGVSAAARPEPLAGGTGSPPPQPRASAPLLTITAHGRPKPKGSLRHVGQGRMVEQLAGSKPWREAVKYAALDARLLAGPDASGEPLPTITGPVLVEITVTVEKPKSAPKTRKTWPITRSSGDTDKHIRNVFDALVDAAAIGDDSQVIKVIAEKVYPLEGARALASPGAVIHIYQLPAATHV